jgi:hypothetical protein
MDFNLKYFNSGLTVAFLFIVIKILQDTKQPFTTFELKIIIWDLILL